MAQNSNSTILIPDISGYTEFMTSTELYHSSHAINALIDAMLEAVTQDYEVAEIEGDAVLLIKRGPAPSKKEVLDTCLKIFNAFHFRRKWMQHHVLCACGACQAIINLSVKFVVHYGPLAEIKVGRFIKHSGVDMIVAHRLLKNSIPSNEYVLLTERLLSEESDSSENMAMTWDRASEDYQSIGKIGYQFSLLEDARRNLRLPDEPKVDYPNIDTSYTEISIASNHVDVYTQFVDIPERPSWMEGLLSVEQDSEHVFIGSVHRCKFVDFIAVVTPVRMTLSDDGIVYAESFEVKEQSVSVIFEFVFKKITETSSTFGYRFINREESSLSDDTSRSLQDQLHQMAKALKEQCEKSEVELVV